MSPRSTALLVGTLLLAACSSNGTTTNNNNNGNSTLTATIDGVAWTGNASSAVAQLSGNGTYSIVGGSADQTSIALTLYNIAAVGTYPLGVSGVMFGGIGTLQKNAGYWSTPQSGLAGSVTITTLTATRIAGTYSYTATELFAPTTTHTVTGGTFDLPITVHSGGSMTVPPQNGIRLSGTVNGTPFGAGSVVFVSGPSSGTLAMGISNNVYNINLLISGFDGTTPKVYTLGTASGAVSRYISVSTTDGTNKTWGYSNAATTGTFTVTAISATRMSGTFSITATPFGASTTGNYVFTGTFDVGFQSAGLKAGD